MSDDPEESPLTSEQRAITEAPPDARILVTAGAGTGKTHVLAARLTHLVETEGLSPGDEVLVLSFSRAAVGELRRRVARLESDAAFVAASTFDSLATLLLSIEQPDRPLENLNYDARIREATKLVDNAETLPEALGLCRHLLVDEVQDLVGLRAEFVLALLNRIEGGCTLFGDPAQAIYEYAGTGGPDLYQDLRSRPGLDLDERVLDRNFRALSTEARRVLEFGPRLRGRQESAEVIGSDLRTLILELPGLGGLERAPRPLTRGLQRTKAVLCRTNGQALVISRRLHELGVTHRLQRSAADRAAAGWIAATASAVDASKVTRRRFLELGEDEGTTAAERSEQWQLLRRLDPRRGDDIDLRRVAERVRQGGLPEELNEVVDSNVVVSTVHRAKGLEFDTVAVVEPAEPRKDADLDAENRVLYVALTRARTDLYMLDAPDTKGMQTDDPTGRWVRRGYGPHHWKVFAIEVVGNDVHAADPAGSWLVQAPVVETQKYLRSDVAPGDEVTLTRVEEARSPDLHFVITHRDRPVGVTSKDFGRVLGRALKGGRPPVRIERLHVETIDTVAGNDAVSRKFGLGPCGLWARVRVNGLGELHFPTLQREKD